MLCNYCKTNKATIRTIEIINNSVVDLHLCGNCSQKKSKNSSPDINLAEILPEFLQKKENETEKCFFCGLDLKDFQKNYKFGCQHCYSTIDQSIKNLLYKIHGAISHKGKTPRSIKQVPYRLNKLEKLQYFLKKAIELEEYEEAAWVKQQIKKISSPNNP